MARRRKSQQVDPFNAGDPIMPWDEAGADFVPLGSGEDWSAPSDASASDDADDHDCWVDDTPRESKPARESKQRRSSNRQPKPRKPSADKPSGGSSGRPDDTSARAQIKQVISETKAAASSASGSDASFQQVGRAIGRQVGKASKSQAGMRGCFLAFVVLIAITTGVISIIGACANALFDSASSSWESDYDWNSDSSSYSSNEGLDYDVYYEVKDEISAQGQQLVADRLDAVAATDEELLARGTDDVVSFFNDYARYGELPLDTLGIDPAEIARWCMASLTYSVDPDSVYTFEENDEETSWSGTAYVDVTVADVPSLLLDLVRFVNDTYPDQTTFNDAEKAEIATKLQELEQKYASGMDHSLSFEFTGSCEADGSNPQAALNEDEWLSTFDSFFGVYV